MEFLLALALLKLDGDVMQGVLTTCHKVRTAKNDFLENKINSD